MSTILMNDLSKEGAFLQTIRTKNPELPRLVKKWNVEPTTCPGLWNNHYPKWPLVMASLTVQNTF